MRGRSFRIVVCAGMAFGVAACQQDLYKGLSEKDANEMMAVLASVDIDASRAGGDGGGFAIRVNRADWSRSVAALSNAGFPRDTYKSIDDVFPSGRLIQTPAEQRARLAYAMGQELSRTIASLQGVTFARVHVALGQTDIRGVMTMRPTASVVLRYSTLANPGELAAQARTIVSAAVDGLTADNVKTALSPQEPLLLPARAPLAPLVSAAKADAQFAPR